MKRFNLNTALIGVGFALLSWGAREVYGELRFVHDAVLYIKTDMVHRQEFDVQLTDLKARMAQVELDIQQLKHRP